MIFNENALIAYQVFAVVYLTTVLVVMVSGIPPPPRIVPYEDERKVPSKSTFEIKCLGDRPIFWKLPSMTSLTATKDLERRSYRWYHRNTMSVPWADDNRSEYESTLRISNSSYLDTGYYVCHFKDARDMTDGRVTTRVYIYVEDDRHLIAIQSEKDGSGVFVVQRPQHGAALIACKPTSPEVEIKFRNKMSGEVIDPILDPDWSYNPRQGFMVENAFINLKSGVYECRARKLFSDSTEQVISVSIRGGNSSAPKPLIDDSQARHVDLDSSFQLNCSVSYSEEMDLSLTWIVPHPEGIDGNRIRTSEQMKDTFAVYNGGMRGRVYQMLTVDYATTADEGKYECQAIIEPNFRSEAAEVSVRIFNEAHIDLSVTAAEENIGENVTWSVMVEAHPNPKVAWLKDGKELNPNSTKYDITFEDKKATLIVRDLILADSGSYQLLVTARDQERSLNFTLRVKDKPMVKVISSAVGFIPTEELFAINCRITSFPKSDVTIFFRKCPIRQECLKDWIPIWNTTVGSMSIGMSGNSETVFKTYTDNFVDEVLTSGRARVSGQYKCQACNDFGCSTSNNKSATANIFVADVLNGIEMIRTRSDDPFNGESFNLTCRVSLYNFSSRITWLWVDKENGNTLPITSTQLPTGSLLTTSNKSYSYTERLEWWKISKAANGVYICKAASLNTSSLLSYVINTTINIRDGLPPVIDKSSTPSVTIDQFNEFSLFCEGYGLPSPKKQWFKDDALIGYGGDDEIIISNENRTELTIERANKSYHDGVYKCLFTNIYGTTMIEIEVDVRTVEDIDQWVIICISVVVAVVVILAIFLGRKMYLDKKRKELFKFLQMERFYNGNPGIINPELPLESQADLLPYDKRWEFPGDRLKLVKQLGAGAFGRVMQATAFGIHPNETITTVAVKMVNSTRNTVAIKALVSELKIMIHLGSHLNVVNLLGACTKDIDTGGLMVIVEFCRFGNILDYMIQHRSVFIDQLNHQTGTIDCSVGNEQGDQQRCVNSSVAMLTENLSTNNSTSSSNGHRTTALVPLIPNEMTSDYLLGNNALGMGGHNSGNSTDPSHTPWRSNYRYQETSSLQSMCSRDLLCWAFQISRGMDYLVQRKVLHGDLAARNILLADDNVVKIADFGLAREIYKSGNYKKKGEGPLPVKWMAIESINDLVFSPQSDVWSFGIVLWELFSLGKNPYPGMEVDENFFRKLRDGYRMEKPEFASNRVFDLMLECWQSDPTRRPTFSSMADVLGSLLESSVRRLYVDLTNSYMHSNGEKTEQDIHPGYINMAYPAHYMNDDFVIRQSDYLPMNGSSRSVAFKKDNLEQVESLY